MQLNTRLIVKNNRSFWAVIVDGVPEMQEEIKGICEAGPVLYGTHQAALARQSELWNQRPEADRRMEALYTGR